jgi:hypothetical protein
MTEFHRIIPVVRNLSGWYSSVDISLRGTNKFLRRSIVRPDAGDLLDEAFAKFKQDLVDENQRIFTNGPTFYSEYSKWCKCLRRYIRKGVVPSGESREDEETYLLISNWVGENIGPFSLGTFELAVEGAGLGENYDLVPIVLRAIEISEYITSWKDFSNELLTRSLVYKDFIRGTGKGPTVYRREKYEYSFDLLKVHFMVNYVLTGPFSVIRKWLQFEGKVVLSPYANKFNDITVCMIVNRLLSIDLFRLMSTCDDMDELVDVMNYLNDLRDLIMENKLDYNGPFKRFVDIMFELNKVY